MMKYRNICSWMFVFCVHLMACAPGKQEKSVMKATEISPGPGYVPVTIIDAKELDGCKFILQMEDGTRMEAVNLPDSVKEDGLKLFILFHIAKGYMSTCMVGKGIVIVDIKPRKQ